MKTAEDRENLRARDAVRLIDDADGAPRGAEGVVLGWYANEPENVIVRLLMGGVQNVPRRALELIDCELAERASA